MRIEATMKYAVMLVPAAAISLLAACGSDTTGVGGGGGSTSSATGTGGSATSTSTATAGTGGSSTTTSSTSATGSTSSGGDCTTQMFAKYGDAAFTTVTNDLVTMAAADAQVGHYFAGLDTPDKVTAFEDSLDKFLVMVYGGPNNYKGKDMTAAHTGLNITSDDYDYFVGLIVKVLTADGVAAGDITGCFAPPVVDAAFKASIVGH